MASSRISRQEQKERTRAGLIRAATQLFVKKGIHNTATADIAKSLRVSHGTVFVHFPTRDDLILAVIDSFGTRLSAEFGHGLISSDLKGLLEFHLDILAEYEDFYHRLVNEMAHLPPKVKSMFFMMNSAVSWKLFEAAEVDMKKGRVKSMSRPLLFNTWIALVQYYVLNRELLSERLPILKEKRKELVEHFLHLIKN